jgi:hypothetical protein
MQAVLTSGEDAPVAARAECAARILDDDVAAPWSWPYSSRRIEPGSKRARPWLLAIGFLCMLYFADCDRSSWPRGARSVPKRWDSIPDIMT